MSVVVVIGACTIDAPTYYRIDAQTHDGLLADAAPPDAQLMSQHRLFVAGADSLRAYDIDTEAVDPTSVALSGPPTDMAALVDGTIVVQSDQELVFVNGPTMTERARLPMGETLLRGVVSPLNSGKQYWVALDDGAGSEAATFIDITADSETRFQVAPNGVRTLGTGHHEAAFSTELRRVVISNSDDCSNVMTVYEYDNFNAAPPVPLATMTAVEAGFDGVSEVCATGHTPSPNGCATSSESGKVYCNLTTLGDIVVVDIDASTPTFTLLPLNGTGGGPIKAVGPWVFALQSTPREDGGSNICSIGQLAVIDSTTDTVVAQLPLKTDPACTTSVSSLTEPRDLYFDPYGYLLYITVRPNRPEIVKVGINDPANPSQLTSIVSSSVGPDAVRSGPGTSLYVTATEIVTPRVLEISGATVTDYLEPAEAALGLATWGEAEGPGEHGAQIFPAPPPACSNGYDDDEDATIDYPADFDCTSPDDDDEVQ